MKILHSFTLCIWMSRYHCPVKTRLPSLWLRREQWAGIVMCVRVRARDLSICENIWIRISWDGVLAAHYWCVITISNHHRDERGWWNEWDVTIVLQVRRYEDVHSYTLLRSSHKQIPNNLTSLCIPAETHEFFWTQWSIAVWKEQHNKINQTLM